MYDKDNAILNSSLFGYAHHRIILDDEGKPYDYEFLEVNATFEKFTGLQKENLINRTVLQAIPGIEKAEFDWIDYYGQIALKGGEQEFEQYSEPLEKWYRVHVYSTAKMHFTTMFVDVTAQNLLREASLILNTYNADSIDYNSITQYMQKISGAKYASLNLLNDNDFTTVAVTGINSHIETAASLLGFSIEGKKWRLDPIKEEKIGGQKITCFRCLADLTHMVIPSSIIKAIEKTFCIGEVIIIRTTENNGSTVGDFTLLFEKGKHLQNEHVAETYADMIGMTINRIISEKKEKNTGYQFQSLVKNIPGVTYRSKCNKNGTMLYVSDAIDTLCGYPASDFINDAVRTYESLIHPEDTDHVVQSIGSAIAKGRSWNIEYRIFHRSGDIKWVQENGRGIIGENGSVDHLDGFIFNITERKQTEEALQYNLTFQKIVSEITSKFVKTTEETFDDDVNETLLLIGNFFQVDRSYLFLFSDNYQFMTNTHEWCNEGITPQMDIIQNFPTDSLPWWKSQILSTDFVHIPDVSKLPEEANAEKEEFRREEIKSIICIPVKSADKIWGFIGFDAVKKEYIWSESEVHSLTVIANTIGKLLLRQQNKNRLDTILSNTPAVIYTYQIDSQGTPHLTFINENVSKILGFSPNDLIESMELWASCVHPDDMPKLRDKLSGKDITSKYRFRDKNGRYHWLLDNQKVLRKESGFAEMIGTWWDITKQKEAEISLQESEEFLRNIFESILAGFWDWNLVDNTEYLSPTFKKMFGYEDHEMENSPEAWQRIVFQEDLPGVLKLFAQHVNSRGRVPFYNEVRYRHKDGSTVWVICAGQIIEWADDGTPIRMAGCHVDITERKRVEDKIKETLSILEATLESTGDGLLVVDREGTIIKWNEKFIELWRIPTELTYEKNEEKLLGCVQDQLADPEEFNARVQEIYNKPEEISLERIELADGRVFERYSQPHRLGGEITGRVWSFRDITQRKRTEEALNIAKEQAETASKAKSEFLANMSHEIRTPMNGVIGMTSLLMDTELAEEQKYYVETIQTSGELLLSLINDILDFSKIEACKLDLEVLDFDLSDMLDDFASILAVSAHDKGLEFICAYEPDVPVHLRGDPSRLQQILTNLTGNAIKFTENGEVVVRVSLESENGYEALLHFSVKDTGIGVPEEKIGSLFNTFYQADASTTRKYGGTGLGLAISKQLVELMGGQIGVRSEEGVGSEFWFTIPFVKHSGAKSKNTSLHHIKDLRILIVDDNTTNREILRAWLLSRGAKVAEVENGAAALQELYQAHENNYPFDVALLDMQMPGMDGMTLANLIRSDDKLKDIPLMMLTSLGQWQTSDKCNKSQFIAFITKPINHKELLEKLSCLSSTNMGNVNSEPAVLQEDPFERINKGLRILLAEDNIVNQKVAQSMLKKIGHKVDTVANGKEAIKALEMIPYDLVIMDVQMPEMDGIEATKLIRGTSSAVLDHKIPIIAMTAHAMTGDRDRFIEAGMDDYIAKPVSIRLFIELLDKWSKELGAKSYDVASSDGPAHQTYIPIFDKEAFMERMDGDIELARKLISTYMEYTPQDIVSLKASIKCKRANSEEIANNAHMIKGSSANIGGMILSNIASEIEQLARAGNVVEAANMIGEVEKQFELLEQHLKEI